MASSLLSSPFKNKTNKNPTCLHQVEHIGKSSGKKPIATVQIGYGMIQLATVGYECASTPGYFDMLSISENISGITTSATWMELRDES